MESEQSKKRSFTKTDNDIYKALPCRYTKGVFRNLCFHRNGNSGLCCPAIDLIAYEEEFERRQVMDAICFMKFAKVITPKKHWKSYHYIIHDDDISYLPNIKKILNEKSLSGTFKVLDDLLSGTLNVPEDELSGTLRVLDQVLLRYHNNIKRNKINKKNNNMNIYVPLHGTCVCDEEIILNLNPEEIPMQELALKETKVINKKVNYDYAEEFELFYSAYPRHKARKPAFKIFQKINPSKELLDKMIEAIDQQKQEKELKERNKIFKENWPLPSTWLSQQRWEDEKDEIKTNKSSKPASYQLN